MASKADIEALTTDLRKLERSYSAFSAQTKETLESFETQIEQNKKGSERISSALATRLESTETGHKHLKQANSQRFDDIANDLTQFSTKA